jgi:hypothetical protein
MAEEKKARKPKASKPQEVPSNNVELISNALYNVEGIGGMYLTVGKIYKVTGSTAAQLIKTGQAKLL